MTENQKKGFNIAKDLSEALNSSFSDEVQKGFVEGFLNSHPTLQQRMFETFLVVCSELSKQDDWDDRKKASIHVSKKIMEDILEGNPRMPFI